MRLAVAILLSVLLAAESLAMGVLAVHGPTLLAYAAWPFCLGSQFALWFGHARGSSTRRTLAVGAALLTLGAAMIALAVATG
jgi:hypothetical protein